MATMKAKDPESDAFLKLVEKDVRIKSAIVYKDRPDIPEKYLVIILLPANNEVSFTTHDLREAKHYIELSIDDWYATARNLEFKFTPIKQEDR